MKKQLLICIALALAFSLATRVDADFVIDSLGDNINQANLAVDVGQTFTTGTLVNTLLTIIEVGGPQTDPGGTSPLTFGLELSLNGAGHETWSPGASLGEVGPLVTSPGTDTAFDFTSLGINLMDNTVYAIRFTDGSGTSVAARFGLSNGAAGGTGGSPPGAFADGTLFSGGALVFGDGFDAAIRVSTIPEPSSLVLLGLGLFGIVSRRRCI